MTNKFDITQIEIREADLLKYTQKDWDLYHEYRKIRHSETNPEDPFTDNETTEQSLKMQTKHPELKFHFSAIIDKSVNKFAGRFVYIGFDESSPSYEGNKHLLQFDFVLLNEYRNKGIEQNVMKIIYDYAEENNHTVLVSGADDEQGKAFLKDIGAETALAGIENRLKLDEVDWDMVTTWAKEGPKRSPDTELKMVYSIPDDDIEQYCVVYTETLNQQPLGDLDVSDIIYTPELFRHTEQQRTALGRKHITLYTKEANGDISGLTEMLFRPDRESLVDQLLTGVQEKYRGRGLGKWLKAEMLLKVKEEFPKTKIITTGNATTNAPMLSINDRLGFKPHKEGITGQLTLETLGEYLKK
jgi:GNAT superfamily N-acetyltransferase